MKKVSLIIITVFYFLISCDNRKETSDNIDVNFLKKKSLYLVFRGTNTKQGFYARDFNIKDSLSSHVGVAIYDKYWKVFNVQDFNDGFSDLRGQTMKEFFNVKKEIIVYASIWSIDGLSIIDIHKIKKNLTNYKDIEIKFDKAFSLKDSTRLYCSEFVCNLLRKANPSKFHFKLYKRELNPKSIYGLYFRKDTLEYYPVDIFYYHKNFTKIKEWHFD